MPVLPATVSGNYAPWDGPAFTVCIPMAHAAAIGISISQAPIIDHPTHCSFPDPTGRVGTAKCRSAAGMIEPLEGTISPLAVSFGDAVEGEFVSSTGSGALKFSGRFTAAWLFFCAACGWILLFS